MGLESLDRLIHQGGAVSQEQDALDPPGTRKQIHQGDGRAGLTRTGRHHQQGLTTPGIKSLSHRSNSPQLIIAPSNLSIHLLPAQLLAAGPALNQEGQLIFGEETLHLTRRVTGSVIPQVVGIAVGIENNRADAGRRLQRVRIGLCLVAANIHRLPGPLGLNQAEGAAVPTPQHVINPTRPTGGGQARHRVLAVPRIGKGPASLTQEQVDEVVAGFSLVIVMGIGQGPSRLGFS